MIPIGVKGIDEVLGGGAPEGARILFAMEPMADGQAFMITMLMNRLTEGKNCCIVIPHSSADVFIYDLMTSHELDISAHRDQLVFFAQEEWIRMKTKYPVKEDFQAELKAHLSKICQESGSEIVFVYFDLIYEWFGLEPGLAVFKAPDALPPPTIAFELLNFEGRDLIQKGSEKGMFDLIVSVQSGYNYIPFFSFFTIESCSWTQVTRRSIPFITIDGTITPYISKIVVTGPAQSGKTTFVANASDHGLTVDGTDMKGVSTTTVAMDLGRLSTKGFDITIYGTPGHARFDPIISQLVRRAMGIILLVDATRPDSLPRAKDLLIAAHGHNLPLVVAITKNDLLHDMTDDLVRTALGIRPEVPVYFISNLEPSEVRGVVSALIDHITQFSYEDEGFQSWLFAPRQGG